MDESKLPKWARQDMTDMRNRIAELERAMAISKAEAGPNATGKVIADSLGRKGFPLHDRASITFTLPDGKITVMLRENGTVLDINANYGSLHILPRASNSAWVTVPTRDNEP